MSSHWEFKFLWEKGTLCITQSPPSPIFIVHRYRWKEKRWPSANDLPFLTLFPYIYSERTDLDHRLLTNIICFRTYIIFPSPNHRVRLGRSGLKAKKIFLREVSQVALTETPSWEISCKKSTILQTYLSLDHMKIFSSPFWDIISV